MRCLPITTIAFDGKTLAADRLGFAAYKSRIRKIWKLTDGRLFGGAGLLDDIMSVRDWLDGGGPKPKGIREFCGILVDRDGKASRIEEKLIRTPIRERFHAVGSGQCFAVTAMALGKTAREAVAIAARFDPRTGGGVDVLAR